MLARRDCVARGDGECFLLHPGLAALCVLDQRIRHVAEGSEHHLLVLEHGRLGVRLGGVDAGGDAPRVEDRQRERGADREQTLRPERLAADGDAADPGRARQEHAREEVGLRDADARRGRGELLLGLTHVGTPLEEARRHTRGHRRRTDLLAEGPAARHRRGGAPEQDADHVLGLLDLALDVGDRLRGARDQSLRLPHVDQGRHPACLAALDELKRPHAQVERAGGRCRAPDPAREEGNRPRPRRRPGS